MRLQSVPLFVRWRSYAEQPVPIAPLATFRVVFGAVMVFSVLRFWYLGWIEDHFIDTRLAFKYYGFGWVEALPPAGMYAVHALMLAGALGIMLGLWYRLSAITYFVTFTYVELIDLTYYLNHYYFVSIASLLLALAPAHRRFSVDVWRRPELRRLEAPRWSVGMFKLQIAIVYVYAGLAKINYDWLVEALPLKIWLPANDALPLVGPLLKLKATPYVFSWIGMLYDLTIVGWLSWRRSRALAYLSVIVFHALTGMMFQIGVFPLVMMGATWIFFSNDFHERLLGWLERRFARWFGARRVGEASVGPLRPSPRWVLWALGLHFAFQLLFPWRYLLYPGNLFWTEEGYRFSWRVMLMEKAGTATFYVKDSRTGREGVVDNAEFLRPHQEKQMAMQPDLILQYAHFLRDHYAAQGVRRPQVRVEAYVTLNARPSRLLIDTHTNLAEKTDGWRPKDWILH